MPKKMLVTAQVPANKEKGTPQLGPVTISVTTGETAQEKIEMFGDEAVSTNSDSSWTLTLQSNIRSGLKKGESQEQLQARLGSAKMGVAVKGAVVDVKAAFLAEFVAATPEHQQQMIKEMQERLKGRK